MMNPVLLALDKELARVKNSIENRGVADKEVSSFSNRLCSLWNSYEGRIKEDIYGDKILELGDVLFTNQCYKLASNQCYGRYLYSKFGDVWIGKDLNSLIDTFFPDVSNETEVLKTIRALIGYSASSCLSIIHQDPKFQDPDSPDNIVNYLDLLQIAMQIGLKRDTHCWLVYNGTIHLYQICNVLMRHGFSKITQKYILWACVSMESSVPLLTVNYFSWRSQLYVLMCQCYFDLKADAVAEKFALRALQKVDELKEIERISSAEPTPESTFMFSEASIKLNIMIFKHQVFESKRRNKGALRSKIKPILKDILHNHWPRTSTERLLAETFRCRASQFLAVIESLTNSNRRLLQTGSGAPDSDVSAEAYSELFFAGVELIAGGGGLKPPIPGKNDLPMTDVFNNISLIHLASSESQSISLASVVRFVKLSFNYESWETFDLLLPPLLEELHKYPDDSQCKMDLKLLNLISLMSAIDTSRIKKKIILKNDESDVLQMSTKLKPEHVENIFNVVVMLDEYSNEDNAEEFIRRYHDELVDMVFIVWTKCRKYLVRINSALYEVSKYQDKMFSSWLKVLILIQKLIVKLDINDIDISACAEASLKLSFILECIACHSPGQKGTCSATGDRMEVPISPNEHSIKSCKTPDDELRDMPLTRSYRDVCEFLEINENRYLLLEYVCEMLKMALKSMDSSRDNLLKNSHQIADDSFASCSDDTEDMFTMNMHAYYLEVTYQYYHIISLIKFEQVPEVISKQTTKQRNAHKRSVQKPTTIENEIDTSNTGRNDLLKALHLLCSVEVSASTNLKENTQQLEKVYTYIQKAIQVESKIKNDNITKEEVCQAVPPPPLLVKRGSSYMVLKPAPFKPKDGEKIRWYSLYLRNASGNNVKVRLNDTKYLGTGEEMPYNSDCTFMVRGLEPNEKYVAAVAAYNKSGKLIGGAIGESSRPFLASHISPCLLIYAKLCRVAYNKNIWKISKMAFNVLWDHFVQTGEKEISNIKSTKEVYNLNSLKLRDKNITNSSLVMLRHFVECIFISIEVAVKEGALFCDSLCDKGPIMEGQIARLNECEKLLIAIEVSGWLNDNMLCLQSVVLIYGLLAPIIHWKLPIPSVLKVAMHILNLLQEIHILFKNKKQNATTEALRHMTCCLGYYVATVLVHFNKKQEATEVLKNCGDLIIQMNPPDNFKSKMTHSIPDDDTISLNGRKTKKLKPKLKTKGGMLKSLSDLLPGNQAEIRALEIYTLKLQREISAECSNELTGNEDVVVMNAVVSTLPIPLAYKEVVKFKRKAQFYEAFVGILGRAVNEGSYENVLEWSKETMSWLTKRNEIILNKSSTDPKGIVVVASNPEAEKLKRYSTAVVEYGRTSVLSNHPQNSDVDHKLDLNKLDSKKSDLRVASSIHGSKQHGGSESGHNHKPLHAIKEGSEHSTSNSRTSKLNKHEDKKLVTVEEKRSKEARTKLSNLLYLMWKCVQRRRKMRNVCFEELPWRCQMNLITAQCHFQMCLKSFENIAKQNGCASLKKEESMMDVNWFTLSTSGAMIVSWLGCMKTVENQIEPVVDIGGTTVEHKPEIHIVPCVSKNTLNVKVEKKSSVMAKHASTHRTEEQRKEDVMKQFLHHLEQIYVGYQRAIVLSRRGHNWVLLQQTCNKLLSTTQKLIVKIMLLNTSIDTTTYDIPFKLSALRSFIYNSFYMAAEYLLDCMEDVAEKFMPEGEAEIYGNINNNKGGSNLTYDYLDSNSYIDYGNIKKVIMFAIEVLFYEQKWERIISVIMKLNSISLGHFSESLLPLLEVSQRCLLGRLSENESTLKFHPSIVFDQNTGIPLDVNLIPVPPEPIEVGAHIDPIGHNLYDIPASGSKYSIVPFEYIGTRAKLNHAIESRPLYSRMLEHSRKLRLGYLAGLQGKQRSEGRFQRVDSAVSFVASQVKPPTVTPIDYRNETFESVVDIETHPITKNLLSVVTTSYENTIEVLIDAKEIDLGAQAMHELGNIMFHCQNLKIAYKWWTYALDTILKIPNALKNWRSLIEFDNNLKPYKVLLDKHGIWGCMLGGLLAVKIARYIHYADMEQCENACHLAGALFKGLFSSSLVHPTSYHAYTEYDVGMNYDIKEIVPGLNLFADEHRIHCNDITDGIVWLTENLIKSGYYSAVQPLLTLAQYLASDICQDVSSTVEVKLLRVQSLCRLNLFSSVIRYFSEIVSGNSLPLADCLRLKISAKLKKFDDNVKLTTKQNVAVIYELCQINLKDIHYKMYGPNVCQKILYMQANIAVSMAELIYQIPVFVDRFDVEQVSMETLHSDSKGSFKGIRNSLDGKVVGENLGDEIINKSNWKTANVARSSISDESKTDEFVEELSLSPCKLKGWLLQYAKNLLMKDSSVTQLKTEQTCSESVVYVKNHILFARIAHQKLQHLSAAQHIFSCLQVMSAMEPSDEFYNKSNRFDIHIWLQCRHMLCFYLINDGGITEGLAINNFLNKVGSIEENLNNGRSECQVFNDLASGNIFEMMKADVDVKQGKDTMGVLADLRIIEGNILKLPEKSYTMKRLHIDLKKLDIDLKALKDGNAKVSCDEYEKVEHMILDELCYQGYDIDMNLKIPVLSQVNVNNSLFEDLISVKVCRQRATVFGTGGIQNLRIDEWNRFLNEIQIVFDMIKKVVIKMPMLEIELLLLRGEIQRHLVESGDCNLSICVNTLLEVVQLSNNFTCDLSTMRRCYSEIALLLFKLIRMKEEGLNKTHVVEGKESALTTDVQSKVKRKNSIKSSMLPKSTSSRKIPASEKITSKEINRMSKCIWICVRAASIVAKVQQKVEILAGEISLTSESLTNEMKEKLPMFVLEDLNGVVYDDTLLDVELHKNSPEITWASLLNYTTHLRRSCSYSSLVIGGNKTMIARTPRHSFMYALKLSEICKYLENNCSLYQEHCMCILPIDSISTSLKLTPSANTRSETAMDGLRSPSSQHLADVSGSASAPLILPSHLDDDTPDSGNVSKTPSPYLTPSPTNKSSNSLNPEKAKEHEVAMQWYLPELHDDDNRINLLIALNNKSTGIDSTSAKFSQMASVRHFVVDVDEVSILHEYLIQLIEEEEASIALMGEQTLSTSSSSPVVAKSPSRRSRHNPESPTRPSSKSSHSKTNIKKGTLKLDKDGDCVKRLSEFSSSLFHLLHPNVIDGKSSEITFDVTWNNIDSLANWMNPIFGHITKTPETLFNWLSELFDPTH